MPLRDHFHTTSTRYNWQALHGFWPSTIINALNRVMPDDFVAQPTVNLGTGMEIDIGTLERLEPAGWDDPRETNLQWSPSTPAVLLEAEMPVPAEYEVRIYDRHDEFKLVAAIELVSPSNKDRPESRQTFVNKCETLLKKDVCVLIVDLVTTRSGNLYGELLDELDAPHTAVSDAETYTVTCRGRRKGTRWRLEAWEYTITLGEKLPTLPVCLSPELTIPLDLEATYEEACRSLRMW
jgi:hypothetical protein